MYKIDSKQGPTYYITRDYAQNYAIIRGKNLKKNIYISSVQLLSHLQLFATPCSIPGFPVHHQHPELTQTRVHQVRDAIQPSHPLSSPTPPAFSLSQHQGLF